MALIVIDITGGDDDSEDPKAVQEVCACCSDKITDGGQRISSGIICSNCYEKAINLPGVTPTLEIVK